jgi:WD40 repeat protein
MSSTEPFALSAELLGHEGPVRALALLDGGRLATGSQDKTAKVTIAKVNLAFSSSFDRVLCNSLQVLLGLNNSSPSFDRCLPQQIWQHSGATGAASFYEAEQTLQDHTHWVTALTALPPNMLPEAPEGGVITGCLDRVIRIYNLG